MDEMAEMTYLLSYSVEWNDGSTTSMTLQFHVKQLKELFDELYEKIVSGSIVDAELYSPEMINEINIEIVKKPNGRLKNKTLK